MDLNEIINKLTNELDGYVNEHQTLMNEILRINNEYDITSRLEKISLDNINVSQFEAYLKKFNFEVEENIKNFNSLFMPNFKKYFPQSYDDILKSLQSVINDINNKIDEVNSKIDSVKEIEERLKELNSSIEDVRLKLDFYKKIFEYSTLDVLSNDKAIEIKKYILECKFLSFDEGVNVVDFITRSILRNIEKSYKLKKDNIKKINDEFEKEVVTFEEDKTEDKKEQPIVSDESLKIKEIRASIEELLNTYDDLYVDGVDFLTLEDLTNIINNPEEIDLETVIFGISYCIDFINNNSNSLEEREKYVDYFNKLKDIYIVKYKVLEDARRVAMEKKKRYSNLEDAVKELEVSSMSFYGSKIYFDLSDEDREYFEHFNNMVKEFVDKLNDVLISDEEDITIELYNELMSGYNKYIDSFDAITSYYVNGDISSKNEKIMKSFIINDIDSNTNEPVVICDFCTRPLIDEAALSSGRNWKDEYSLLINELITYGEPLMLLNGESNVSNYTDKIDDFVCFDRDRKFKTGMHRYRATRNSNVRFVEEIITLKPNTPIFNQVKGIILKYLPDAVISNDKDFTLYINFANMVKKMDKEGYNVAIRRLGESSLMKLFYQNGKYKSRKGENDGTLKTELTDKDLSLLEEYISRTIDAYKKLNNDYGFNINFVEQDGLHKEREV